MLKANIKGFLPYEPGDYVIIKDDTRIFRITEIRMLSYIVAKRVVFEVKLEAGDYIMGFVNSDLIEKRVTDIPGSQN